MPRRRPVDSNDQILWSSACLGDSVGLDTVHTDRDGLSEKPEFNPRVDR